ncbi:MAG: hypothetical protein NTV86_05510, partial [Planctomycetota bacterium]|nr:hypothetical protein [Planctomycetota bacterium]
MILSPLLLYALVIVLWNLTGEKEHKSAGLIHAFMDVGVVLLAVAMIHFASGWFDRRVVPRMMPTGWMAAILLPLLGGGLVAAELIWLQVPPRPTTFLAATPTWLADEAHYAGAFLKCRSYEIDAPPGGGVFWRDGGDLQQVFLGKGRVTDVLPCTRMGGFLVAREDGLFALARDHRLTAIWMARRALAWCQANDEVTRAVVLQPPHTIVAIDLVSGKNEMLVLSADEEVLGVAFSTPDTACLSLGKETVTALFDGQGWRFSRSPSEVPGGRIIGAAQGRCVWAKSIGGDSDMLVWKDHRILLAERVFWAGAEAGSLFALSQHNAVYRLDWAGDFARFKSPKTFRV